MLKFLVLLFFSVPIFSRNLERKYSDSFFPRFHLQWTDDITLRKIERTANHTRGYIHSSIQHGTVPAAAIYVSYQNRTLLSHNAGLTPGSSVYLASLTKPFTSLAILQLVEKGQLNLDTPVRSYLPGFKMERPDSNPITIRHLLTHTSGIPYDGRTARVDSGVRWRPIYLPSQLYAAGKKFEYSNANYHLLAHLVERITGMTFPQYMQTHLFAPMEMTASRTAGNANGAGGISSSIEDLSHFARMLLGHGVYEGTPILREDLLDEAIQPSVLTMEGTSEYYGLGWHVVRKNGRIISYYHAGLWNGGLSDLRIFPEERAYYIHLATPRHYRQPGILDYRGTVGSLATGILSAAAGRDLNQ